MLTIYRTKSLADKFFEDFFRSSESEARFFSPNINIKETNSHVIIEAELPGIRKEDVKVIYQDGAIRISGEKKTEKEAEDEKVHVSEASYGTFQRIVPLNESYVKPDSVAASFQNGILRINMDKVEEKQPKQIEVNVS